MSAKALTQIGIAAIRPSDKRREVPDGKIGGLYLVVQPSGAMSWAYRYRSGGQPKKLTIGAYPAIDLVNARRLAGKAATSVAEDKDPAAEKQTSRVAERQRQKIEVHTVRKVFETYLARHAKPNTRASSSQEVERLLRREALPFWGDRALSGITKADVHVRLDQLIDRGAPVMANRFLAVFRKMCAWAMERGIIASNPCAGIRAPTTEISRDRVLSDDELRVIWKASDDLGWPFGPIVKLLMLTGQRKGEVATMRWSDVDIAGKTWTIPKERAKNGIEHTVPLSSAALEILRGLPTIGSKSGGLVFTITTVTPVSGFTRARQRLDKAIVAINDDPLAPFVLHDLRRTAASGMARLGINLPVIEKVLNHISGSFGGIVGVYQRHSFADEKRVCMDTWGRFLDRLVSDAPPDNVVEIAEARA